MRHADLSMHASATLWSAEVLALPGFPPGLLHATPPLAVGGPPAGDHGQVPPSEAGSAPQFAPP
jgi:hypothetical protein